jgi:hypothetical protein
MSAWVIDQLWILICIGIAGGIAGAVYQSRRSLTDQERSSEETQLPAATSEDFPQEAVRTGISLRNV